MISHKRLMNITRNKPMRVIEINEFPYLQRYYMGTLFGRQFWLHRFLRNDAERHLHNHPWRGISIVLRGGYTEELRKIIDGASRTVARFRKTGEVGFISFDHTHRVAAVAPNTWTLMIISKTRKPVWHFIGDDGNRVPMESAGADWWQDLPSRAMLESRA